MKKILALFSALLVAISLCGSVSEAKTQTKSIQTGNTAIDKLEVHFIDVGQGDATLIQCGDAAMLIDAGESDKGTAVQEYIKEQGVKSLDYLIVTEPEADHSGGADVIISKYDIDKVIYPNCETKTKAWRNTVKALDDRQVKVTEPVAGDVYRLGDAEFTIIAPNSDDYGENVCNYSVGILVKHGDMSFIFTGDAEEAAEADILKNKIDISANVLHIGKHGGKASSTEEFIKSVSPQFAVISCGKDNESGYPHEAVLNILKSNNVKVFRTDEQGTVVATSDGKKITWDTAPSDTWKAGDAVTPKQDNTKQDSAPAVEESEPEAPQDNQSQTVHITKTGKKYHNAGCASLSKSDMEVTLDEALSKGLEPCKRCH